MYFIMPVKTAVGLSMLSQMKRCLESFVPVVTEFYRAEGAVLDKIGAKPKSLEIAAAPMVFQALGSMLLYAFKEENPGVELNVREMPDAEVDNYVKVSAKHLGILAIPHHRHGQRFNYTPIRTFPLSLCVYRDHPLAKEKSVSFDMLKEEGFLLLDNRSYHGKVVAELCGKYGYKPRVVFTNADVNILLSLVNNNKGVLVAVHDPAFSAVHKDVVFVPIEDREATYSVGFIYQSYDELPRAEKKLIDFVRDHTPEDLR